MQLLPTAYSLDLVQEYYSMNVIVEHIVPHLQSSLSEIYNMRKLEKLNDQSSTVNLAMLNACSAKNASAWMNIATSGSKLISNDTCTHAHRMRLGLQPIKTDQQRICVCGTTIVDIAHLHSCKSLKGGDVIKRHDKVVESLAHT